MTSRVLLVALCGVLLAACKVPPAVCASGAELDEDVDQRAVAAAFLPLVPGVYGGAAKNTPLGDLALLTMDLRAVSGNNFDGTVFGRADVDADNTLRFQFALEDHGAPTFIFRNGGKFWASIVTRAPSWSPRAKTAGAFAFAPWSAGVAT